MALPKSELTIVVVEGEEHKMDVVPKHSSKVVISERRKILGAMDLQKLVTDIGRVGKFVRIAYNGVGAAGPKFTDIQIEIQRVGYDVTRLCDKSALTLAKFERASATVITSLEATYGYLIRHMEKMALVTLTNVSKLAGQMAGAALELYEEFEIEQKKVVGTLEKTQKTKGDEAKRIEEKKNERQQLLLEQEKQRKLIQDLQRLEREAEAERHKIEQMEDDVIRSIGPIHPILMVMNAFTSSMGFDECAAERLVNWKEKKMEVLKKKNEILHKQYEEAVAKVSEVTDRIQECKTEDNMAETAESALHHAVGALKQLADIIMQAAQFWKQMEDHCKSLAEKGVKAQIEAALEFDEDMRMKIWTSKPFKKQAICFYAEWVALKDVCTEFMEQMKVTQRDLHEYLRDNPTHEESRQNIKTLVEEFLSDLKYDQRAIESKKFQAQEEIEALEGEIN